MKRVSEQLLSL